MGSMQAYDLAELALEGSVSKARALLLHLTSNHYPPLDRRWLMPAKWAIERGIEAINQDCSDPLYEEFELPNSTKVKASDLIENLHLEAFIEIWVDIYLDDIVP